MKWSPGDESMETATDAELHRLLGMRPLPSEGGYFVESYRSPLKVDATLLGKSETGQRSLCTAIYYMLTPAVFSALHKLKGDEIYHFYAGDPVELLQLYPDGSSEIVLLGQDLMRGMRFQHAGRGRGSWGEAATHCSEPRWRRDLNFRTLQKGMPVG